VRLGASVQLVLVGVVYRVGKGKMRTGG
jgi:hypothetical protein